DMLVALVQRIQPYVARVPGLTWFEVVTALAFMYFAEAKVDVAVVEVGLGGRLDATNIITAPIAAVITSLSYDHQYLLGNTLAEIAGEKAGIIKPGIPVVSAPQHPEALQVLRQVSAERHSPLTVVGLDTAFRPESGDARGQFFWAGMPGVSSDRYWTPLLGEHQVINAATALAALHFVRQAGFSIRDDAIRTGLRLVDWPGRFEIVRHTPGIVLDVAHNGESAERLAQALTAVFAGKKITFIFGAFTDKDVPGMFHALLPLATNLVLMQALNPRAYSTDQLADLARQSGYSRPIAMLPAAQDALAYAEQQTGADDVICVTGSVAVVGEMRSVLKLPTAHATYLDERVNSAEK
ncbi:MAG TPA: cyanophycin synthetase, partial [Aggregatilineales bacterium]|nr:cyanophycin synthetase [Aggregatilineales bacterium]